MLISIEIERIKANVSCATLAEKLTISKKTLKSWINSQEAIPASKLIELKQLFGGCSTDYLLKKRNSKD